MSGKCLQKKKTIQNKQIEKKDKIEYLSLTSNRKNETKLDGKSITFRKHFGPIVEDDNMMKDVISDNDEMYVSGADFGYPDVMVKTTLTTVNEVKEYFSTKNRDEILSQVIGIKKLYRKYTSDDLYSIGELWQNFCNDLVVFYLGRHFIDNKYPMPVFSKQDIDKMRRLTSFSL